MARIVIIQPCPDSRLDSRENLTRALKLLDRCRDHNADLICFPEYFPFWGEEELAREARRLQAYIVAGLMERAGSTHYNTATLFDRQGNLQGRQRKRNLGNLERRGFDVAPGDGWQVMDTDMGRIGMPVCIDFWGQPDAARELAAQGADLIVNPSIFPILRGHWQIAALVRAFDYYLPVVGVNTADFEAEIAGRRYPMQGGGSFTIQPLVPRDKKDLSHRVGIWDDLHDWVVSKGGSTETILACDLDLAGPRHWRPILFQRFGIQMR